MLSRNSSEFCEERGEIIHFRSIGVAHLKYKGQLPKHRTLAEIEGALVIDDAYCAGLRDIQAGQRILVVFYCHRSPAFTPEFLTQALPHRPEQIGVFSLRSPIRPNAIGVSVLTVLAVEGATLHVAGLDVFDGTPILDIKPLLRHEDAE
jgi:tRNA (adenine37-N6)-methyltransferase